MAVLEQEVQKPSFTVHSHGTVDAEENEEAMSAKYSKDMGYQALQDYEMKKRKSFTTAKSPPVNAGLTLLRLKAWMQEPMER